MENKTWAKFSQDFIQWAEVGHSGSKSSIFLSGSACLQKGSHLGVGY
jgi:hypothetical protein